MKCEHKNSAVKNSRPYDHDPHGLGYFKPRPYPFLIQRRRRCMECGEMFSTVEVKKEVIDELAAHNDPKVARKKVLDEIRNYLEGRNEEP